MTLSLRHAPGLALNFKVNASSCPVLGNFFAVKLHREFRNARPPHAAHSLGGFGNGILGGFGETLFGRSDDFDDFLRHGWPPLLEREYIAFRRTCVAPTITKRDSAAG